MAQPNIEDTKNSAALEESKQLAQQNLSTKQLLRKSMETFAQLPESGQMSLLSDLISLFNRSSFKPLLLLDLNCSCPSSKPFDLISCLLGQLFAPSVSQPVKETAKRLSELLAENGLFERKHCEELYSLLGQNLEPINDSHKLQSQYESIMCSISLLRAMLRGSKRPPTVPFFYFLSPDSGLLVQNSPSFPWAFNEGFTFVTWWYCQTDHESTGCKRQSLFRLKSKKVAFECVLADDRVTYQVTTDSAPGFEISLGTVAKGVWNFIMVAHDLTVSPSHISSIIGGKESMGSFAYPATERTEEGTKEISFFENVAGASSGLLLYGRTLSAMQIDKLKNDFVCGVTDIRDAKTMEKVPTEDLRIFLTPGYCCKDVAVNFCNHSWGRNLRATKAGDVRYSVRDKIDNVLPFIHLAQLFEGKQGTNMLNESLKLITEYVEALKGSENSVRLKHGSRLFKQVLGHHLNVVDPGIANEETLKLIREIMKQNEYLRLKLFQMLVLTINFWMNTNDQLYAFYWNVIQETCFSGSKNYSDILKLDTVLLLMESMGTSAGAENCCSKSLRKYYVPMVSFLHSSLQSQRQAAQSNVLKLLSAINKKPCHCMFVELVRLLLALVKKNGEYFAAFNSLKGAQVLFASAEEYPMDAKFVCLQVLDETLALSRIHKIGSEHKESDLIHPAFAMFKSISQCKYKESPMAEASNALSKLNKEKKRSASMKRAKLRASEPPKKPAPTPARGVRSLQDTVRSRLLRCSSKKEHQSDVQADPKELALLYEEITDKDSSLTPLKFGGINPDVLQLYNYLLLWALGARPEDYKYGSDRIKLKKMSKLPSTSANLFIVNSEPICLLMYITKKMSCIQLTERLIKDMLILSDLAPENRKALLLQSYFVRQLIRLEHKLLCQLRTISDESTVKLSKKAARLLTCLVCEELCWTTSSSLPMMKLIVFSPQLAEAKKAASITVLSATQSARFLWKSVLSEFAVRLAAHQPVNIKAAVWVNVVAVVVMTAKMLVGDVVSVNKNEAKKCLLGEVMGDGQGGDGDQVEIGKTMFEVVACLLTNQLGFLKGAEATTEMMKKRAEAAAAGKSGEFYQHVHLLSIDVKDEDSVHKMGRSMTLHAALAALLAIYIDKSDSVAELGFWIKNAATTVNYLMFVAECAKTVGETSTVKRVSNSVASLLASIIKSQLSFAAKGRAELCELINNSLTGVFQFMSAMMQFPHSSTVEFYKKYFSSTHGKLMVPLEQVGNADSVRNCLENELSTFYQQNLKMKKLAGTLDTVPEDVCQDSKSYAAVWLSLQTARKGKLNDEYKLFKNEWVKNSEKYLAGQQRNMMGELQKVDSVTMHWKEVWERLQRQQKQWRGAWRNRNIFSSTGTSSELPQKLSKHFFANGVRCVMTLRSRRCKYMDMGKYPHCFEDRFRPEQFFCGLRQILALPPSERKVASFSLAPFPATLIQVRDQLGMFLYCLMNTSVRADLPPPIPAEIYTNICAKKGRLLFFLISANKGYLIFVKDEGKAAKADKRMMYNYDPGKDLCRVKKWPLRDIRSVLRKWIVDSKTAVEIAFYSGRSVLLNFEQEADAETVCKKILKLKDTYCENLKYEGSFEGAKILEKSKLTENWMSHKCSTFDYLLALNNLSSRSFNNLSQYPVFPWLIVDFFSETLSLQNPEVYRDLTKSIGMGGDKDRAEKFRQKYLQEDLTGQGRFNIGSHYSNPGIVIQFLMRIYPIFETYVKFFSGLDIPNRMFHSIAESWNSVWKDDSDVRELIPEFYSLPEMFLNNEKLRFGKREDDNAKVDNVILPRWTRQNPYTFVVEQRHVLESLYVSQRISRWIDLVFGYQQRGKEAERAGNVFPPLCYEPAKFLATMDEEVKGEFRLQAFDWGQTPQQLFAKKHVDQFPRGQDKVYTVCDACAKPRLYCRKCPTEGGAKGDPALYIKMFGESVLSSKFVIVTLNGEVIKGSPLELGEQSDVPASTPASGHGRITTSTVETSSESYKSPYTAGAWKKVDPGIVCNYPIVVLNVHTPPCIIQGGCLDGTICITSLAKTDRQNTIKVTEGAVTCLAVDKEERIVIAGTDCGDCLTFETGNAMKFVQRAHLQDHSARICFIHIRDAMCMFVTAGADGCVNIYSLAHKPKLIRTIYHPHGLGFNFALLSESPMASVVTFSTENHTFYSYSINGKLLCESNETTRNLISPIIARDSSFNNYLVYFRDSDYMMGVRKLPWLDRRLQEKKTGVTCLAILNNQKLVIVCDSQGQFAFIGDPKCLSESQAKM